MKKLFLVLVLFIGLASVCHAGIGSPPYNPSGVAINGGTINGTSIGATTASTGRFSTVEGTEGTFSGPVAASAASSAGQLMRFDQVKFKSSFTSGDYTAAGGSVLSIPHGLGVAPSLVRVVLKCVTAELGYSVGDVIEMNSTFYTGNAVLNVASNITNVYVIVAGTSIVVLHRATTTATTLTNANWKFVVRAWAD